MDKFILYVKVSCPYCQKAEDLLTSKSKKYNVVPFDDAQDVLIFHAQDKSINFVGGYTDLVEYLDE